MDEIDSSFFSSLDLHESKKHSFKSQVHKPKKFPNKNPKTILYKNALSLAKEIKFEDKDRYFFILDGSFVFGDFIEAFIVHNNIYCKRIYIATLSMSYANVESLVNIMSGGFCEKLNLIVSEFFFAHERNAIIPYIYKKLIDDKNSFQLAVAGSHCKICLIETLGGKNIVMHGSANLRSSNTIEQLAIEDDLQLFDFNAKLFDKIMGEYKTVKKHMGGRKLFEFLENGKQQQ